MPEGRYRIVANGFTVNNQTWDDALNADGWGDEVQVRWSTALANSAGNLVAPRSSFASAILGDVNQFPSRQKAGSATASGGLKTGNTFPTENPRLRFVDIPNDPAYQWNYPPMVLWEGTLRQGEHALLCIPSVWEYDPGGSAIQTWITATNQVLEQWGQTAAALLAGAPIAAAVIAWANIAAGVAVTLTDAMGKPGSRPVGISPVGINDTVFEPQAVVLTYESAENTIANAAGGVPGLIALDYVDTYQAGNPAGHYSLFLQVEKWDNGWPPPNPRVGWPFMPHGHLAFGGPDVISWTIEEGAVDPQEVAFVLKTEGHKWRKEIVLRDGRGGVWTIATDGAKTQDENGLYLYQLPYGNVTFRKAGFLGRMHEIGSIADLGALQGGSRVTFLWLQD